MPHFCQLTMRIKILEKLKRGYRDLPHKKQYIEFITAILSIPVLLSVILINYNNLKGKDSQVIQKDSTQKIVVTYAPGENTTKQTNTPSIECKKTLPPITISSPDEGDTVVDNPVNIVVYYDKENYCSVVWAYRINNGKWSDYDDKSLALYNLPQGDIHLDLKIKSIVTGSEKILTRNFTYKNNTQIPSPTVLVSPPSASPSASQ